MFSKEQKLCRRWLLACALGIPVGLAIGQAIGWAIGSETGIYKAWALGVLIIGPGIAGMLVGVTQWLVLRGQISPARQWIIATSIGWVVAHAVTVFMGNAVYGIVNLALWRTTANLAVVWAVSGAVSGAISGAIGGILVGLIQWRVLRGHGLTLPQWILASSWGWAAGHAVIGIGGFTGVGVMDLALRWAIYGIFYGIITSQPIGRLDKLRN
jgi:hypothetical protein